MSIWIHRDTMDRRTGEEIYKKCIAVEELSSWDKMQGKTPKNVLVFKKDSTGQYFIVPYRIARQFGYHQNNPNWRQIVYKYKDENGKDQYYPQFTGTFRDYQEEVIPEIIECMQKNNTVIIGLPPGWGKTIMAAYLIWMIGLLPVVIVKQSRVYLGWQKTFKKVLPQCRVWLVGDEPMPSYFDVILCMNERVSKIPLYIKMQVGVLIIDEAHTISTLTQVDTFLDWSPKYIILETATLKAGPFWRISTIVAGEDGVFRISKIPYNFYVIKTGVFGEQEKSRTGNLIASSVQKSLIENLKRQKIIQSVIYNHINYRKFMAMQIVTKNIDDNVGKLENLGIECDTLWGTKKSYNQCMVLFGTYGKISTGFDEENSCDDYWRIPVKSNTMIFINSVLSSHLLIQAMGRCMRTLDEVPAFIFLLDDNNNVKNHLNSNKWLIELTNGVISYVDYKTAFIPINPTKGFQFSTIHTPGTYYKILANHEYSDFLELGFYIGNQYERDNNFIMIQTAESVAEYKKALFPTTKCFILVLNMLNLFVSNSQVIVNNGIVFCKHTIFFRNVVQVSMI